MIISRAQNRLSTNIGAFADTGDAEVNAMDIWNNDLTPDQQAELFKELFPLELKGKCKFPTPEVQ